MLKQHGNKIIINNIIILNQFCLYSFHGSKSGKSHFINYHSFYRILESGQGVLQIRLLVVVSDLILTSFILQLS